MRFALLKTFTSPYARNRPHANSLLAALPQLLPRLTDYQLTGGAQRLCKGWCEYPKSTAGNQIRANV